MESRQYSIELVGETPLLMHKDNLVFNEKVRSWQLDPLNKELSVAGDDRTPAWTWIGRLYTEVVDPCIGVSSDNIMTMFREAGSKVLTGRARETYKRQTQYGLVVDQTLLPMYVNGEQIEKNWTHDLLDELDFEKHIEAAEDHCFELFVKHAVIGRNKHVRVRPKFTGWVVRGTITVFDEEESGLTQQILQQLLDIGGSRCGLCDWRPSSPRPGSFGKFKGRVELLK